VVPSVMKGHILHLLLLQRKALGVLGGGLRCVALTRMSRRLLKRRYDMRGGEGNATLHRCEEQFLAVRSALQLVFCFIQHC